MAELRGHITVRVDQAGDDEAQSTDTTTAFGLPGSNGIPASMSSCHFDVHVAVYDDLSVYVGFNGQISDPVVEADYEVRMTVNPDDWAWQLSGGSLVGPSGATNWNDTIGAHSDTGGPSWAGGRTATQAAAWTTGGSPRRWFLWNFSCGNPSQQSPAGSGYQYVGLLTSFHGNDQNQDGYLYIGGTGTYQLDDPLYPDPMRITVPGFLAFLDYFPWAIRKSGSWMSCNRSGGSLTIRKSGSWRDVKNIATGTGDNKAFYRQGSNWAVAPEIGAK